MTGKITINRPLFVVLTAVVCLAAGSASAHRLGEGYIFINVTENGVQGEITVTLDDLGRVLPLDADGNGVISENEAEENVDLIRDYVFSHVGISLPGEASALRPEGYEFANLDTGKYISFEYSSDALDLPDYLDVRYSMLFDADPSHRGFLVLQSNAITGEAYAGEGEEVLIFTPGARTRALPVEGISYWQSFGDFLIHGVWHIWIGLDHILFLVALVLPSVLTRTRGTWRPVSDMRKTLWTVIKIVTLFTIAHTITLTLATLSIVDMPSRLVESVIAASVAFAALNNVYPVLRRGIGYVVFAFGLFHGFGFASVLQDLIVSPKTLVVDLLAFNVGVEIGQIAIVAVVVPLLFAIRSQRFYIPVVLKSGSALIGVLAIVWLAERSLNVQLPV